MRAAVFGNRRQRHQRGRRRIVRAVDGDSEHRGVGVAMIVRGRVVEAVGDRTAAIERLHRAIVFIHDVGVGAVAIERQATVGAYQSAAERTGRARAFRQTGAHCRHREWIIQAVSVVRQHVAGRVATV